MKKMTQELAPTEKVETVPLVKYEEALAQARARFLETVKASGNQLAWASEGLFAMKRIRASNELQQCNPWTLIDAMAQVAAIGLSLNPSVDHVYLIPNKGQIIPWVSYRGLVHLAIASGAVSWVQADEVYENDHFVFEKGMSPKCEFRPVLKGVRGKRLGAFCVAKLPDGTVMPEFMPEEDLEMARKSSKARTSPAWEHWGGEMRKKAVLKRASKLWPHGQRVLEAVAVMNQIEGSQDIDSPPAVDITALIPAHLDALRARLDGLGLPGLEPKLLRAYGVPELAQLPEACYEEVEQRISRYADMLEARKEAENANPY